jgi:hypothetical protein
MRTPTRTLIAAVAAGIALAGLSGCSSDAVQQATDLGSSVASSVAEGVQGIDGKAIQDGMASVAGGIDGALDTALKGANVTSDGKVPDGFPTKDVPLVDGTVLGGGAGPNGSGWVVQLRVDGLDAFSSAQSALANAGFASSTTRSDSSSAFGMYRSDDYRVILAVSKNSDGTTATYIVTPR